MVPFKKGPDYIDAGWLAKAVDSHCYNLDPYLMAEDRILDSFHLHGAGADYVVVEGNRGLYDGVNAQGGFSTAELAILLQLPVILVVNCTKATRTVAAMVLGCKMLDPRIDIRGVILNQVATKRQERIIVEAVKEATGIPVLGVIPRMTKDIFPMRHLGMIPHQEYQDSDGALDFLVDTVNNSCDIAGIKSIMADTPERESCATMERAESNKEVTIGVLQDAAFQFYYSENLQALEEQGARLIYLNALTDHELPRLDGLYIGGGFPETSAPALAQNESFRLSVNRAADNGLPIYAECGGLIYLGQSIQVDGNEYPLAGVFPVRFGLSDKPQGHGYTIFSAEKENPYYPKGLTVKGHEFRYSVVLDWDGKKEDLALKMKRGRGFEDGRDGLVFKNVLALYTHVHVYGTPQWAEAFVSKCRSYHSAVA